MRHVYADCLEVQNLECRFRQSQHLAENGGCSDRRQTRHQAGGTPPLGGGRRGRGGHSALEELEDLARLSLPRRLTRVRLVAALVPATAEAAAQDGNAEERGAEGAADCVVVVFPPRRPLLRAHLLDHLLLEQLLHVALPLVQLLRELHLLLDGLEQLAVDLHDVDARLGQLDHGVVLPLHGRVAHVPRLLDELVLARPRVGDVLAQGVALLRRRRELLFRDRNL